MIDEKTLEKLAQCAYEAYADMIGATSEEYIEKDILHYNKLSNRSKEHWRKVANAVVLASWNLDYGDIE
jgi:hypothetical protein